MNRYYNKRSVLHCAVKRKNIDIICLLLKVDGINKYIKDEILSAIINNICLFFSNGFIWLIHEEHQWITLIIAIF